jgi:hypothetical protein
MADMNDIKQLYSQLRALPWPKLGKNIGDFGLYDALLTGCADVVFRGGFIEESKIPIPDEETMRRVDTLRKKDRFTQDEKAFLEYFNLLEEIRHTLEEMTTTNGIT